MVWLPVSRSIASRTGSYDPPRARPMSSTDSVALPVSSISLHFCESRPVIAWSSSSLERDVAIVHATVSVAALRARGSCLAPRRQGDRWLRSLMGYRADIASNGIEAIERQGYDLVLMDVQMPEMDGIQATEEIVERIDANDRPWIVAMTANAMDGDRERCIEARMNGYISKPIRVEEIVEAVLTTPLSTS